MGNPYDPATIDALSVIAAFDPAPLETMGADAWNYLAAYWRDIENESPAKTWWGLKHDHPAIARALRIDRSEPHAWYALLPFRYLKLGDRHLILAAYPTPKIITAVDQDWLGIETVIAWEPTTGAVSVMTDDRPQLVGRVTETDSTVFAEPRAFFTAWMRQRAWFMAARVQASQRKWSAMHGEPDLLPGALIVGDPDKISWPVHSMPDRFTCVGIEPKRVNKAIIRSARLPMCAGIDIARAA